MPYYELSNCMYCGDDLGPIRQAWIKKRAAIVRNKSWISRLIFALSFKGPYRFSCPTCDKALSIQSKQKEQQEYKEWKRKRDLIFAEDKIRRW